MVSEKRTNLKLIRVRLAPRRPSVLIGRKKKTSKRRPSMTTAALPNASPPSDERSGPSEELLRYRRGEITEAEYLAGRIEEATSHLNGRVSPERLAMLKDVITQRLQTDPQLVEARSRLLGPDAEPKKLPDR